MPNFFSENIIFDGDGIALGNCYAKIVESWNSGKLADALGLTEKLSIFGDYATQTDNGYGTLCPVELLADISVSQQLYFGQMPIAQMSGFKDEMTGHVITNAFSIGLLDPKEIIEKWLPITSENDLVAKPVLRLEGVIGWDENAGVEIKFW